MTVLSAPMAAMLFGLLYICLMLSIVVCISTWFDLRSFRRRGGRRP